MYNSGKGLALIKQVQFNRVDVYINYYLQVVLIYKILFPIHGTLKFESKCILHFQPRLIFVGKAKSLLFGWSPANGSIG